MKNILISIAMIILIILLAYIFKDIITVNSNASDERFILINSEWIFDIYYDKETKVQYSISRGGNLTVLVDTEGKPLLYQESKWFYDKRNKKHIKERLKEIWKLSKYNRRRSTGEAQEIYMEVVMFFQELINE